MDTETLTNYLGHVYNLESELYGISETIKNLNWKRGQSENIREKQLKPESKFYFEFGVNAFGSIVIYLVFLFIYSGIMVLLGRHDDPLRIIDTEHPFLKGIGTICGIFFVLLLIQLHTNTKDNAEIQEQNGITESENNQIREYRSQQISLYDQMIRDVQNTYNAVYQTLNEYYSLNIIFPKYQGLVPVASFYEYLASGRCDGLTGVHGAYNKYEEELRQNLIIAKLDTVIQQLESIKGNQFMLYQAINNQTQAIINLNGNVQNAMNRMDFIQATQYVQAYNQEILAKNSQELVEYKRWNEIRK